MARFARTRPSFSTALRRACQLRRCSGDRQQLDLEHEGRAGRYDRRESTFAVAELGRDCQLADAADFHALDTLVPAANDLTAAKVKREALAAIARAVEFGA